jgi:hypothetical protein
MIKLFCAPHARPLTSHITLEEARALHGGATRGVVEVETMSLASSATLAESSIDILLWNFPLKSHSADAAQADLQTVKFSSTEVSRRPSCRRQSRVPRPSCSWRRQRRGSEPRSRYICTCPALPSDTPVLATRSGRSAHCSRPIPVAPSKSACR